MRKASGLKSALRYAEPRLAREEDFFLIEAGDAFEAGEQAPEGAAEEDQQGHADHQKAPEGDFADLVVVNLAGIGRVVIEFAEEMQGQHEVQHGADGKGTGKQQRAVPEQFGIVRLRAFFRHGLLDERDVEDRVVVEKGLHQRGLRTMGKQHGDA